MHTQPFNSNLLCVVSYSFRDFQQLEFWTTATWTLEVRSNRIVACSSRLGLNCRWLKIQHVNFNPIAVYASAYLSTTLLCLLLGPVVDICCHWWSALLALALLLPEDPLPWQPALPPAKMACCYQSEGLVTNQVLNIKSSSSLKLLALSF